MPDRDGCSQDTLLAGRVRLIQPRRGHRAGTDAVLLAASARASPGDRVVDLGAGTGAVGLMIAARVPGVRLVLVEREPELAALCRENLALNGVAGAVIEADLLAPHSERRAAGLVDGEADVVVTNPPFLEAGRARRSPDPARASAHELASGDLERWLAACVDVLASRGRVALIHRADRLPDLLRLMPRGLGGIALRFVHPRAEAPANRVLLQAQKGSRAPLEVAPPLVLHENARFTAEAGAMHEGRAGGGIPADVAGGGQRR